MKKFKTFLEEYRIFFETIVAVFLTIAGIFVSCSANKIALRQQQINTALSSPIVNLSVNYDENEQITGLTITNVGSAIYNLQVKTSPYLSVLVEPTSNNDDFIYIALPLSESPLKRYTFVSQTGSKIGEIASVSNYNPAGYDTAFSSLHEVQSTNQDGPTILGIVPKYFLKISYTDVLGKAYYEVYDIQLSYPRSYTPLLVYQESSHAIELLSQGSERYQVAEQLDTRDIYAVRLVVNFGARIKGNPVLDPDINSTALLLAVEQALSRNQFIIYNYVG